MAQLLDFQNVRKLAILQAIFPELICSFLFLANTFRGPGNELPSTVTVRNLNHMIHLLSCCCLANTRHYLQVAKAMMDQVAPSVVPDHVAWPTREHFKYYMEM